MHLHVIQLHIVLTVGLCESKYCGIAAVLYVDSSVCSMMAVCGAL